jgi:hypothetical protein
MEGCLKLAKMITTSEQKLFPKTYTVRYFNEDADTRDLWASIYATETIVNNEREETYFYEGLNHEANLVIECKLPNGVIR